MTPFDVCPFFPTLFYYLSFIVLAFHVRLLSAVSHLVGFQLNILDSFILTCMLICQSFFLIDTQRETEKQPRFLKDNHNCIS